MNHAPTQKEYFVNLRSFFFAAFFIVTTSVLLAASAFAASGDVDPSFVASVYGAMSGTINVVTKQPDGKILVGGNFTVMNGTARHGLARLNADGTLDTSFDPPDFYDIQTSALGSTINTIALQSNGKIVVGGKFLVLNSNYRSFMRLNADGSIDNSFNLYQFNPNEVINKILVRADDTIYIGGSMLMNRGDGVYNHQIVKLNSNGIPDINFLYNPHTQMVKDLGEQPGGKIVYVDSLGSFPTVKRINTDGSPDNSFGIFTDLSAERMVVQSDGKVLICGSFTQTNGFPNGRIARINADGTIDVNFNLNMAGANIGTVNDIDITSGGSILIGGTFTSYNGTARNKIAKLNADGSLDSSFNFTAGVASTVVKRIVALSSGQILVGGDLTPTPSFDSIFRLNSTGSVDGTFTAKTGKSGRVREILQQPDGKILIAGEFPLVNGVLRNSLARLNADGSLDTSFVPFFSTLPTNQIILAIAWQSDGKVLVGVQGGIGLKRLNVDGTQDITFNPVLEGNGVFADIIIQPNGQILVGGLFRESSAVPFRRLARFNTDGTLDAGFITPLANNAVNKVFLQSDGKILIGGDFTQLDTTIRGRIARVNSNGSIDASFNPPGGANGMVYDIDVQSDGKVVLGGAFFSLNGGTQSRVGRLNADGTLDTSFAQSANVNVLAVKLQPDGKILIGGQFTVVGTDVKGGIARLNSNGSLDTSFNTNATIAVSDISLQSDNKILLGGDFTEINNTSRVGAARLLNNVAPPRTSFDYDGDGKADVSVFRASEGNWYILRSSDFGVTQTAFAVPGDVPAPADFDGDGKTDVAIFRSSNGNWWSLSSVNGQQINAQLGLAGDIPLPSDFDGDGRADYVVFRPSTSQWLRTSSANGSTSNKTFGLAGDKPVIGDFDGDGKSDVAIYRPSDGNWWWQSSVDNIQRATRWGIASDIPAPADFDGDGKTDFAVFRPSTGVWYIYNSSTQTPTIGPFGLTGDKPVPADFDGDGKADIAVYRPSDGIWYLLRSTTGFTGFRFGIATDTPTQNAFLQQ